MKTPIQTWKERLSKGTIIYRLPPSPLDIYKPVPAAGGERGGGAAASK